MSIDVQKYVTQGYDILAEFAPKLISAIVIFIVAYIVAKLLGRAVAYLIDRSGFGSNANSSSPSTGQNMSKAVFWVVMLIALPAILGALGLQSIIAPLQSMAEKFLTFIPNLFGAGLIFFIGYIVATVVRNAIESICAASNLEGWSAKAGIANVTGEGGIGRILSLLAFALIIIPVSIAALDALQMTAIATPAKQMLNGVLTAIPNVFAAGIVLAIAFLIAKFASSTISGLLAATGMDKSVAASPLSEMIGKNRSASAIAGQLTSIAILLFGIIEAAKLLNFAIISEALTHILALGGSILLGAIIIVFGVFAAGIISKIIAGTTTKGSPLPGLVKAVVIILASAMGLKQMGVGEDIVTMGFTLMIGALALGSAIAIGLGGQDAAKKLTTKWTKNL